MPADRGAALLDRRPLDERSVLLTFRHPEVAAEARPGQFVMLKTGLEAGPPLRRPFSILEVSREDETFGVFVKIVGGTTRALAALRVGEPAQALGPLGRPFSPPPAGTRALLVAGGYGVAPFFFYVRAQPPGRPTPVVLYGGRSVADLTLREAFEGENVTLLPATEDGSLGHHGRVTELLATQLDGGGPVEVLACGPHGLLQAVAGLANRRGVRAQVSLDPWMGCGLGTCLGCVVWTQEALQARPGYRCACTHGPVFDSAVVVWPGEEVSAARQRQLEGEP